ncbi:hypothetical protein MKX01_031882 [Papaver californicum]|nr:hypothetical protein MKX01_031882 [Papaver californicum]
MLSITRKLQIFTQLQRNPFLHPHEIEVSAIAETQQKIQQLRCYIGGSGGDVGPYSSSSAPSSSKRRTKKNPVVSMKNKNLKGDKSEWWVIDGEMHEIGEQIPPRERFVIPRDNLPNKRRKQMREQFMRRTRLVLKEQEHEPFCKRYMELYQELRENWERLYWDEGYSKKLAQYHADYESGDEDDQDFSPYRRQWSNYQIKDQGFGAGRQGDNALQKAGQIRDKFEYDRERRMRDKAFAPMSGGTGSDSRFQG